MKICYSYFILFTLLICSNARSATLLVDTNQTWSVVDCINFGPCGTTFFSFGNDTLINSQIYKKLEVDDDSGFGYAWGINTYPVGMREDSIAQSVFIIYDSTEYLIYDFSLNQGDSTSAYIDGCTMQIVVDSADTISLLNGELRKRLYVSTSVISGCFTGCMGSEIWIEGIGSLHGLLHIGIWCRSIDYYPVLNCFQENYILKYQNPFFSNCLVYSVDTKDLAALGQTIVLYPNPSSGISYIEIPNLTMINISITSLTGQVLSTRNNNLIDLTEMPTGMYIIKIETDKGTFFRKIIRD